MTDSSANLKLPYIMAAQAQKHVTHNEAIRALDAIVQLSVKDRDLTTPPSSPANGDRYLVAMSASGEWVGKEGQIAAYQDNAWMYYPPLEGWLCWIADEDKLLAFDGTFWNQVSGGSAGSINPAPLVGVNATADTTNRLAISSANSLFNHEGSGHRLKINKNAETDTASLIFQTGFSGRAEFGSTGDDDFHVKVSADGSSWHDGFVLDKDNGALSLPASSAGTRLNVAGRGLFTDGLIDPNDSTPAGCALGYDTVNDYAWIGAIETGVAQKALAIQPLGGAIAFGSPTADRQRDTNKVNVFDVRCVRRD